MNRRPQHMKDEDLMTGCLTAIGCGWIFYAVLILLALVAAVIILWRYALG